MRINKKAKIFLAGHNGMVGSAIFKKLIKKGYKNIITQNRSKLNLLNQNQTFNFIKKSKPNVVIIAAAKVGGIVSNLRFKDKYLYENLQIQNNILHGSFLSGVKNLILLGSSCIYPKYCKQPMIAKIAGIKMCEYYSEKYNLNYKSFMPPNLYGSNDNYDLNNSHFYPALISKIHNAKKKNKKELVIWGTGKARRELMFVDDFADALVFFMNKRIKQPFLNIGTGKDYPIKWYANFLMKKMNIKLKIKYDKSKPDGMPKKCLDIGLAKKYGWKPKNDFNKAFDSTYSDFLKKNK